MSGGHQVNVDFRLMLALSLELATQQKSQSTLRPAALQELSKKVCNTGAKNVPLALRILGGAAFQGFTKVE